jgi:hypothetical protein
VLCQIFARFADTKSASRLKMRWLMGSHCGDIAGQFQASKSSIDRHQRCIAAELKAFRATRSEQLTETLIQRLDRYRLKVEQFLDDDEKVLPALDRCYKQVDIEAKLTGAYQQKRENEHDKRERREILIESLSIIYERRHEPKTREEIAEEVDDSMRAVNSVWEEAKQRAQQRGYIL